ncbi:MAG: TIM-barrel domain-containing protein [Anaerolineales bacterium]
MRLPHKIPANLTSQNGHTLTFSGGLGSQLTLSALTHTILRVQHWPDGTPRLTRTWAVVAPGENDTPPEGRPRANLQGFDLPHIIHSTYADGFGLRLQTDILEIEVNLADFRLSWARRADGATFAADASARAYPYDRAGRSVWHYMQRMPHEHYYGFGERSGPLDKAGLRMTMKNMDALGYDAMHGDPLYKHIPFYITLNTEHNIAYGLLYDNFATTHFDMGREIDAYYGYYRGYHAEDGDLDYYFIYGPTIANVVQQLSGLIGRMALPPRWSLGFLGSTMSYTEADNAQEQLAGFADLCAEHDIPCDMFHLSSGYTTGEDDGNRYVFNWNRQRVPDPQAMVAHFHQAGIRVAANVKPYLLTIHPRYNEVAGFDGFIRDPDDNRPALTTLWSGGALESASGAFLDFTAPRTVNWWQANLAQHLLDYGIDAIWNDNNEFELWDDEAFGAGHGEPIRLGLSRPVQTLLMTRASFEAQQTARPAERPYVLCRSGMPGVQRYAQTWSGDNTTSWESLRYSIPMGLGLSLSGLPNTGHDVGGFYGPKPDPELFLRWVQCGVFMPRFCIHSFNDDGSVNEPWMYPDVLPQVREAMQFRYRLMPYLYSLFYAAATAGAPIQRPLVYVYQDDPRTHQESFQFLLGPHLMVAPVLEADARTRAVYLPAGVRWCNFHTGAWHAGGQSLSVPAPLEMIPLFAPAGSIIPLGKPMRHVGAQPDDLREVLIFPAPEGGEGTFTLVEDDGVSVGYKSGDVAQVHLSFQAAREHVTIRVKIEGDYPLPYEHITFILPPGDDRSLIADVTLQAGQNSETNATTATLRVADLLK